MANGLAPAEEVTLPPNVNLAAEVWLADAPDSGEALVQLLTKATLGAHLSGTIGRLRANAARTFTCGGDT